MLTAFRSAIFSFIAALAFLLAAQVHAIEGVDYTDIWVDTAPPPANNKGGFGINFVQSGNSFDYIFVTFFIYNPATGSPDWVTGDLRRDMGKTSFSGNVYRTQGDPTSSPFAPRNTTTNPIGTIQFTPTTSATGTLVYVVNNVTTTLSLKRMTLTENILNGTYWGMAMIRSSNCTSNINNGTFFEKIILNVAKQAGSTQATYTFTIEDYTCTMKGTLVQEGRFQKINNASYVCHSGNTKIVDGTANLFNIAATTQGIEGEWTSNRGWGNCKEETHFTAVLKP
ncbi:MAG: hypothetical protein LBI16_06015 [Burkholderiales bacterium]|jgi:hypothetical protein|nr:hypothetical protein [Burkholderiales bacterium]